MADENTIKGKLDLVLQRLDQLTGEMKDLQTTVSNVEASVDTKIDEMKEAWDRQFKDSIQNLKKDIVSEVKDDVKQDLDGLREEVKILTNQLNTTEQELHAVKNTVDIPFNPDKSIVIYNLL